MKHLQDMWLLSEQEKIDADLQLRAWSLGMNSLPPPFSNKLMTFELEASAM